MKVIFLIMIGLSGFGMAEMLKEDGVVIDTQTTLEWQDDYRDNDNNVKSAKWIDAIDYCERLSLNSQTDWRLPNKNELVSIVDYNYNFNYTCTNPSIDSIFEKTVDSFYWSSTTYPSETSYAWYVSFYNGNTGYYSKSINSNVRCVRAGQ